MEFNELQSLIDHGEDTRIEYKRTIDFVTKYGRAELTRDLMALANAHDTSTGYLIVGVDETDRTLHDASALGLDDGRLHSFFDEYLDPPIPFSFRYIDHSGVKLGLFTLAYSNERFHVVKKDVQESGKTYLTRGEIWIRRGARRDRPTSHDMRRLREEASRQYALPQPYLEVSFSKGTTIIPNLAIWEESERTEDMNETDSQFVHADVVNYKQPRQSPDGTMPLYFTVKNTGNISAESVIVKIKLPKGCYVWEMPEGVWGALLLPKSLLRVTAHRSSENISLETDSLIHGLDSMSKVVHVVFPNASQSYEFPWIARAGNMVAAQSGVLTVQPHPDDTFQNGLIDELIEDWQERSKRAESAG